MKKTFVIALILFLVAGACRKEVKSLPPADTVPVNDSSLGQAVADTIVYDVVIRNLNPDDAWASQCLRRLDRSKLVNDIFDMIYDGKALAYNHETNEKMTPRQVKDIESQPGFSRNDIAMIQFKEAWYLNVSKTDMTKKVISMVLGMDLLNDQGELFGHKALFRVEMK